MPLKRREFLKMAGCCRIAVWSAMPSRGAESATGDVERAKGGNYEGKENRHRH